MKQNFGVTGWRLLMFFLRVTTLGMLAWLVFIWFRSGVNSMPAQLKTAQADFEHNDPEGAQAELDKYLDQNSTDPDAFESVVGICMSFRRWQTAMSYAQQGLRQCNDTTAHERALLYTALSNACFMQGSLMSRPALAAAQQAYVLDPTDPDVLNTLGYVNVSLSTDPAVISHGMQYIEEALAKCSASPMTGRSTVAACEDSYGWGLYRLSLYGSKIGSASSLAQSLAALNQAAADLPKSSQADEKAEIYLHLATVNASAGQQQEALSAVRVALFYNADSKEAARLLKTLTVASTTPAAPHAAALKSPTSGHAAAAKSQLITAAFTSAAVHSQSPVTRVSGGGTTISAHSLSFP